jgi:hypothetical protein
VGFFKALRGYNPSRNNGFWAYAAKFVRGAVVDCVHDWHHRGGKGETRNERTKRSKHRPIYVQYNGFEGFHYDLEGGEPTTAPIAGRIAADDAELRECDGSGGKVTDADWDRIVAGRAHPSGWWGIRRGRAASFRAEPLKPISRSRYEEDRTRASRFDTAAYVQRRLCRRFINIGRTLGVPRECFGIDENPRRNGGRYPKKIIGTPVFQIPRAAVKATPPLLPLYRKGRLPDWQGPELPLYLEKHPAPDKYKISASARGNAPALGIIGYLAKISDERARRHLKQVGRKAYALELARKDRTVIIHLFARTPMTHCIPINTAATASDSKDWKDYSTRLADAEAAHPPMVWSERDKWGSYRVIDMRPKTYRVHETTSPQATPFHLEQANYNETAAVAA